ncbi:glycosyl hydrolase family 65 protein [Planococcus sp. ISL-109]|uniref:glycoside hydrolase family 65 protein n=1 Tax=Planococcus sp. ISL-109 TaxID=2819166 RepID=UPI001BE5D3B6|nr:glycosyl hydrolase family 65 protein [Planococcus sp. ISL-109]MBT2583920.1 glycoside hydrolase family 65 protein [Planococcus sp. ISL-109]
MMNYSLGTGQYKNWLLSETAFSADTLGKSEAVMLLGNGYMGLRSDNEEPYLTEQRNLFINGTFNKAEANEVTELPNAANITRLDIRVDGERFSLEFGETENYIKQLNMKEAELTRSFDWTSPKGKTLRFCFSRFVSLDELHLIGMKMEVESLTHDVALSFDSGINAQMTNSGVQHFREGERRILDERFIQLVQTTGESGIDIVHNTVHTLKLNGEKITAQADKDMARRKAWMTYNIELRPQDRFVMEKLSTVHTSKDSDQNPGPYDLQELRKQSLEQLKAHDAQGYETLFEAHRRAWQGKVWGAYNVEVESSEAVDQLALRFSLYHLTAMMPAHDEHMGIGAKALSGEGYKGHSFWDTEIFILPFFILSNPEAAKSLLTYRYHGLAGARQKAVGNGYAGAMYPWEMAWPTDGEVTPVWGDIDIVTGEQTKIWSGFIEQHISADIAFAVYQYENITGDQQFMERCGYEMVFETAKFWASRFEWNDQHNHYHINGVIGPDEYKEHINNNAFTNHMAYFNLKLAMRYADKLSQEHPDLWKAFGLDADYTDWQEKADRLYLPEPRVEDLVMPQDDTYLQLPEIDLAKYKNQSKVRTIYRDYNAEQINGIQVTKQADTVLLFYLIDQTFLRDDPRFSETAKKANFRYYEARTLHDSSLSLATHAIMANDIGERELAYGLFRKTCDIDMGPDMKTSDEGIHAASIGGIWKSAVFGFAGVRLADGKLRINPRLPKNWQCMRFPIYWQGLQLQLDISHDFMEIEAIGDTPVEFETGGTVYKVGHRLKIPLNHKESLSSQ